MALSKEHLPDAIHIKVEGAAGINNRDPKWKTIPHEFKVEKTFYFLRRISRK